MSMTMLSETVDARTRSPGASADEGEMSPEAGQKVLVLQGGGALGAYQGGVYEALVEREMCPDWVIGTSIGAINAALIAGNRSEDRLPRLKEFWRRVKHGPLTQALTQAGVMGRSMADAMVAATGIPGFFAPTMNAMFGFDAKLSPERAGLYSTAPLARTLGELIDFDILNDGDVRLTVGAADLRTAEMRYFDSALERLTADHILASCALPPAFPAVRIDDVLYWDGGIVSNTPVEAVFDDRPRRSSLVFTVHMWNPDGAEPDTLAKVMSREKDVRFSSRAVNHIARQKQLHRLRHVVAELTRRLPDDIRDQPEVRELSAYGCMTRMHVVRLLAPTLSEETSSKDIDFSEQGVQARWTAGRSDTLKVLDQAPWRGDFDPIEGFILHEADGGVMIKDG